MMAVGFIGGGSQFDDCRFYWWRKPVEHSSPKDCPSQVLFCMIEQPFTRIRDVLQ